MIYEFRNPIPVETDLGYGMLMYGDYLETGIIFPPSQDAWNAAKEGKQP